MPACPSVGIRLQLLASFRISTSCMTTPEHHPQSGDERSTADMEKDAHIGHHEQEESHVMNSMFADAATATG